MTKRERVALMRAQTLIEQAMGLIEPIVAAEQRHAEAMPEDSETRAAAQEASNTLDECIIELTAVRKSLILARNSDVAVI